MPVRTRPAAIVFDVGGTLLQTLENPQHVALRSIEDLGAVDPGAFAGALDDVVRDWWANGGTPDAQDLASTWVAHYRPTLERVGFPGDAANAARRMEAGFLTTGWRVFSDVPDVLSGLSALGIPLGIVSNWPPTLSATLERAGIRHHFSVIIASGDAGYAKPHARIFQLAAEGLGVAPADVLYIGDDMAHDIVGATEAGMEALLIDRAGRWPGHQQRLSSLGELVKYL